MPKELTGTFRDFRHQAAMTIQRIMTKRRAAEYCGLSMSGYQAWVNQGLVPGPLPGTKRYDRAAIDRAIDKLSGIGGVSDPDSEYDAWKCRR